MTIQWFPGHMLETEKLLKGAISKIDGILEILDARLPDASANPFVDKLCRSKLRIKVLNKADLADPEKTLQWIDYFQKTLKTPAISICGLQPAQTVQALTRCIQQVKKNRARKIKIMVIGIPNTGKSTILNTLAGRKVAKTGNKPAITRHQQRTSLKNNIDLYDTPGILWPVIEPVQKAYRLAASGAIADNAIEYEDIAYFAAEFLASHYPKLLKQRYAFLDPLPNETLSILEKIAQGKGCLKKGGLLDLQKASETLIRELRAGKIGRISFETPEEINYVDENCPPS